jgi:hypothetical protein
MLASVYRADLVTNWSCEGVKQTGYLGEVIPRRGLDTQIEGVLRSDKRQSQATAISKVQRQRAASLDMDGDGKIRVMWRRCE